MTKEKAQIVLFGTEDKSIFLPVEVKNETVWLSVAQIAVLFDRDEKTLRKHVNNVFKKREVKKENLRFQIGTSRERGESSKCGC